MLKRQIKKIISNLKVDGEYANFYSQNYQGWCRTSVRKINDAEYGIFSSGQNWSDQIEELFDFQTALRIVWSERPHECL